MRGTCSRPYPASAQLRRRPLRGLGAVRSVDVCQPGGSEFGRARLGSGREYRRVRRTVVAARSTDTFGRVLLSARDQHFVIDGPVHNGCPGEAVTPPEAFLAGVAACGVELLHVIARDEHVPLRRVRLDITGEIEPGNPVREGVMVFNRVRLHFELDGVNMEQGERLVTRFKGR